jgi:hypothetical protein
METSALRRAGTVLLIAAMCAALAACGEKPQRVVSEEEGAYNLRSGNPLVERTRNQGESERIAY